MYVNKLKTVINRAIRINYILGPLTRHFLKRATIKDFKDVYINNVCVCIS